MWPEDAFRASDGVIHSRIFVLRVEPPSVRKDILHIPQYQLNFRHLSFTAAASTQNLDLPGFPPLPGFPGSAGVTRQQKSELSAHQNPCAGSTSDKNPSSALIKSLVPAHLRDGFPRGASIKCLCRLTSALGFLTFSLLHGCRSFSACPSLLLAFLFTEGPARLLFSITMHAAGAPA